MDDIYKHIEEYNTNKKHKIVIVLDDIITDMFNKKNLIQLQLNYLLEVENLTFFLLLLHNPILMCQKM